MTNTNYPIGDFLIRIKNAGLAELKEVSVPKNNQIKRVAEVLAKSGFLENYSEDSGMISARLSYSHKKPVILGLKLVSKPGLRVYMNVSEIEKIKGPSIFLVSTPKGILSSLDAIKKRLGGEVIAEVW